MSRQITYSRFATKASKPYIELVEAIRRFGTAESWDEASCAYAEAVADVRLDSFVKRHGLTRSRGHVCVNRLIGKSCPSIDEKDPQKWFCPSTACGDHLSLWNKDGKPHAIVSQPYGPLQTEHLSEILKFCERYGLDVEIDCYSSWHFPTQTLTLIFTKRRADQWVE